MVSKIFFVVALSIAVFQVSEARTTLEDDFTHFVKPVSDAYESLKEKFQEVVTQIQENPVYKNAAGTVNDKYNEAQQSLFSTYDKLATCRKIIFEEGHGAAPVAPTRHIPQQLPHHP